MVNCWNNFEIIKPYYQDESVTIYNADCRDILPLLPKVDLVIADPPYNIGWKYDIYKDVLTDKEYYKFLKATLGTTCVLIHYPESVFRFSIEIGIPPEEVVAWVYHANIKKQWRSIAWFGSKPDFTLDSQEYRNKKDKRIQERIQKGYKARLYDWWEIEQVKCHTIEKTRHPCQIPEKLIKRIIKITPRTKTVLDPFMGSGTTLRAAKDMNRKAIGIEISEKYCEIAAKRMSQMVIDLQRRRTNE